ncbi:DUF1800 domain-containing protein [Chitinivorax sp. B]|uniref:DUF1800 domain-containing protein n=1 Tax=Chitinivorax sp. B TaxID=2502235 RepID=UPI0010F4E494|nr:DUF1800 domain-containing protein [Chitinivorax sp. B]
MKKYLAHVLSVCLLLATPVLLQGCGGGGSDSSGNGTTTNPATLPDASPVTQSEASRFLAQASFGPKPGDIEALAPQGYARWLETQFAMAPSSAHQLYVDQQLAVGNKLSSNMVYESFWKQAAGTNDQLRQRMAFALSEIFVISLDGAPSEYPRGVADYLDVLGKHAFGNYRDLLEAVSLNPMMGLYLSHLRNRKEDPARGRVPDENYAREVMQLFSIGLNELNPDGTPKLVNGKPVETYTNDDVSGLARVFTGWSWGGPDQSDNRFYGSDKDPNRDVLPMQNYAKFHSSSEKRFLGTVIPAGTGGKESLQIALDRLFNHPNTAPFISRQLIQRLVTSNPSPAYVQRVATAFTNNGQGVRGDMKSVIRVILLDSEARDMNQLNSPSAGKLREPVVRLANWMRAFAKPSVSGRYLIGNTDSTTYSLGQTPMRSPSVFNFFRPGYVPPGTAIAEQGLVAPEFQITHETSVVGYYNLMQDVVAKGIGTSSNGVRDVAPDYAAELALADNPDALVNRVELMLSYGSLRPANRQLIRDAVNAIAIPADVNKAATARRNRVQMAIYLVMVSPEYLIQR